MAELSLIAKATVILAVALGAARLARLAPASARAIAASRRSPSRSALYWFHPAVWMAWRQPAPNDAPGPQVTELRGQALFG